MSESLLAWAGWQLRMPREWQPLKLTGTPEKGQMIVGDAECAIFIVKWERADAKRSFDGPKWVAGRLKKLGVRPDPDPPAARQFTACGWAHGVQTQEDKETTYWYGYSQPADLFIGVTVNGVLPEEVRNKVVREVLPTLAATPAEKSGTWAMYDVSFTAPAGFELAQRHLFSGDIALEFAKGRRETLLLRQVYPGELALERRPHEKWLESYPFKEHRRLRRGTVRTREWKHASRRELGGVQRLAWKRLPAPLGWCAPRRIRAMAVHDASLNRLLLVEHMAKGEPDEKTCVAAIESMNAECGTRNAE